MRVFSLRFCCYTAMFLVVAGTQAQARVTSEIVQWGETSGDITNNPPTDRGTGLLPARSMANIVFVRRTQEIPAQLCRHFGALLSIRGEADDVIPDRVVVRVHHPLMTAPSGASSEVDEFHTYLSDGRSYAGFTFERRWELRTGPWTIEFLSKGQLLGSKSFMVVAPDAGETDSACPGKPVS